MSYQPQIGTGGTINIGGHAIPADAISFLPKPEPMPTTYQRAKVVNRINPKKPCSIREMKRREFLGL